MINYTKIANLSQKSNELFSDFMDRCTRQLKIGQYVIINGRTWQRIRATKRNDYTTMFDVDAYGEGNQPIDPALLPRRPGDMQH